VGTPAGTLAQPIDPTKKFTINFTGLPPTEARQLGGCQVSLYLFHVAPNAAHGNTFPLGGRARTIPTQPLALTLYYLLSAHSTNSYIEEQQAMSIALKCLHEHPITTATVPLGNRLEEFTLTLEPHTVDEIGRLWQALATPLGLSAVYRASVIFLEPEEEPAHETRLVLEPHVDAIPVDLPVPWIVASQPASAGVAMVTGSGFDAATIELTIGGFTFAIVAASPPGPGEACVIDATTLRLRFPGGTPRGRYLLRVRRNPQAPIDEVLLELPQDAP
jgi:hypothetical protein